MLNISGRVLHRSSHRTIWHVLARLVQATVASASFTLAGLLPATAQLPCPADGGCAVQDGNYQAFVPESGPPRRALMFFHGFGGSARSELDNALFRQWAERERIILILPDGRDRRWSVNPANGGPRDDVAFAVRVLDNARARLPLADLPLFVSGFSLGGSMVWALACSGRISATGFIPFSGAFWEPAPAQCEPISAPIIHFHGMNDTVVPMAGREVRSGLRQAPLAKAISAFAATNICEQPPVLQPVNPSAAQTDCAAVSHCSGPGALLVCQHHDGHGLRLEWLSFALARMQGTPMVQNAPR